MRTFKHKLINWLMEFVEMKWKQMESWNLLVLLNGPKRTRLHAIQQFNFDLISALPNGRNQSKWMLTADAAPRQTAIQDELRNCLPRRVEWIWFVFLFVVGYGRWHRQWLRRKEKTKTNQIQIQQNKEERVEWTKPAVKSIEMKLNFV